MLKVHSAAVSNEDKVIKRDDGLYMQVNDNTLFGELSIDEQRFKFRFQVKTCFTWDGASNVKLKLLQKVFPSYVDGDAVYNFASKIHDWLYARTGNICEGFNISREECDDFLRGVARESETMRKRGRWARFCCGCADLAVGIFAGSSKHWGNDTHGIKEMATLELIEV